MVGEGFRKGFQGIWGRFVVGGDPTLGYLGSGSGGGLGSGSEGELGAARGESWRPWNTRGDDGGVGSTTPVGGDGGDGGGLVMDHSMLNLNVTKTTTTAAGMVMGRADWRVVDGLAWEGGRGRRCALWAEIGVR